jgi:hypothetical protein
MGICPKGESSVRIDGRLLHSRRAVARAGHLRKPVAVVRHLKCISVMPKNPWCWCVLTTDADCSAKVQHVLACGRVYLLLPTAPSLIWFASVLARSTNICRHLAKIDICRHI